MIEEIGKLKGRLKDLARNFRRGKIGKAIYLREKEGIMIKLKELKKELAMIRREKLSYSEKEQILLGTLKHKTSKEIKKLDQEYERGTLDEKGYQKTRKKLIRKLEKI